MLKVDIEERVKFILSSDFEIPTEDLTPASRLHEDLGLDSLDAIDMLVYLEEDLKIKVDSKKFITVRTLGDVYQVVEAVIAEAGASSPADDLLKSKDSQHSLTS